MLSPSQIRREREREEGEREKEKRKRERKKQTAAELLLVVFMFSASFHFSVCSLQQGNPPSFSCWTEVCKKLEGFEVREGKRKDLKKNKSFDHMSGSFSLCLRDE